MIGVSSSSRDFAALAAYLARGRTDDDPDRVAWMAARNLPTADPDIAATIMHASAARNARVGKPVYHLAISFDPGDRVDRATMERVADRVIETLGLGEHQVLIVAHQDRDHPHLHLLVNRVHPETGRAWSRWQDQRVVQRVLRELEQALGLRSVPGRLAPVPQLDAFERAPGEGPPKPVSPAAARPERGTDAAEALVADLRAHERAVAAQHERLTAQVAAHAARARHTQLETAVARAHRADEAFRHALATMYADPASAYAAFHQTLRTDRVATALRALRDDPARYGSLRTVETRRLGMIRHVDDGPAHRAAPFVVGKARDAVEAERLAWAVASADHRQRAEDGFSRAMATLYREPDTARDAFSQLARAHGAERALTALRSEPSALGEVQPSATSDARENARAAGAAAEAGERLLAARAAERADVLRVGVAHLSGQLAGALGATRSDVEQATRQVHEGRSAGRDLPSRREREWRLRRAAAHLLPNEITRVAATLTTPQRALLAKARRSIRDVLLGREHEVT